jgi:alginate biosynthesis protein AlgX
MTGKKTFQAAYLLLLGGLVFSSFSAQAEQVSPNLSYGYKTYLKYHPPKDKPVKYNLYPFTGPIIEDGKDIPVCAAARTAGAYAKKKEIRFLSHGQNGWIFRTIDFRTDFTAATKTIEYFTRLNKALSAHGQTLVAAFQPTRGIMEEKYIDPADKPKDYTSKKAREGYKAFLRQINDTGIIAPDLSEAPPDVAYFPKGDFHWTPAGAAYAAERVSKALHDISAYDDIRKQDFKSEVTGMGPADRGAFEEFLQQTCHLNIELTTEPLWTTQAAAGATNATGLLSDDAFPAITVLGTSNSAEDNKFNFVGSLKHFARADIYNAAVTGGGFGASSSSYYASDEYHEHPPKIIVWEFLPQHNYNNAESLNAFRQMIPAVYGACDTKAALAQYSGDIARGQTELFTDIKDRSLKDAYLYLEATEPKERAIKVEVLYKNGEADQVDLTRSTRAGNNGKYYLELAGDTDKSALLFHVITDVPQGKLTARICQYPVHVAEK